VTGLSVHHVTLTVTDVDSSAQWYQRLLGPATVVERRGPSWRRIRLQWPWGLVIGVTCHDSTMESSFDCTRVGLDHLGLACADEAEVRWWLAHVDELGVEHGPLETPSYGWAVTARDPDGIAIEFFSPARAAAPRSHIDGVGLVSIRAIPEGHPRPNSPSVYEDWGEMAAEAMTMTHERWLTRGMERSDERVPGVQHRYQHRGGLQRPRHRGSGATTARRRAARSRRGAGGGQHGCRQRCRAAGAPEGRLRVRRGPAQRPGPPRRHS
jgi:glyoxylase I family protein